jgi:hypothetical protein
MKRPPNAKSINAKGRFVAGEHDCTRSAEPFEINVIFTDHEATAAAVKASESLARGLADCIRLRAAIVVPLQLPLDQPLVSMEFFQQVLRQVAGQPGLDGLQRSIHLYVCRDWVDTLLEILKPDSVVVMGVRKSWFPKAENRLARALRKKGVRVVLIDPQEPDRRGGVNTAAPWLQIGRRWTTALDTIARRIRGPRPRIQSAGTREVH